MTFLPEFDRKVLKVLREPLESGVIHIARASRRVAYPARFQLVAAMNPCPCGFLGSPDGRCRCTPDQVARYVGKLSGPLLDRIDLHVEVPAMAAADMQSPGAGEASAAVRSRVIAARERQRERQGCTNARLDVAGVGRAVRGDAGAAALLATAVDRLGLSTRAYHRVLRLARSIADLAGAATVGRQHVAEAIQFRRQLSAWTR